MEAIQKQNGATTVALSSEIVSNIVLKGDISGLTQSQKVEYYRSVCERVGLDPATQPFQLLTLSGKQVLYCSKAGAEQLTKIHRVSHEIKDRQTIQDIHIVYVRASLPDGRFEDSSGAVTVANLKGDTLCNALMKAETKAKRRSTLSLLGLGMLDETEIETIPGAIPVDVKQIETVNAEGEIRSGPQPKQQVAENVSVKTFDPQTEVIGFGKHKGTEWAKVPVDYLQFLTTGNRTENTVKAEATLKFREQIENQNKENAVNDLPFGDKPVDHSKELPPLFDILEAELGEIVHKFGDKKSIKFWGTNNAERIHQLTTEQQETFRKAYQRAMKEAQ